MAEMTAQRKKEIWNIMSNNCVTGLKNLLTYQNFNVPYFMENPSCDESLFSKEERE